MGLFLVRFLGYNIVRSALILGLVSTKKTQVQIQQNTRTNTGTSTIRSVCYILVKHTVCLQHVIRVFVFEKTHAFPLLILIRWDLAVS
jgi:hypothetical protein